MKCYLRSHLSNDTLHNDALAHARNERGATADLLADLAEIELRKFFLAMAYPSLFAYCVAELKLSDSTALKRIKVARAARRFPIIFEAVADGRLRVSGVLILASRLTEDNAPELLAAAMNQTNFEIEQLLAARFPRPDVPDRIEAIPVVACTPGAQQRLESLTIASASAAKAGPTEPEPPAQEPAETLLAVRRVELGDRSRVKPIAPQRYGVHFIMSEHGRERLGYLQNLLGFESRPGDLGPLFEDAIEARIKEVEKQKFAATGQPHTGRRSSPDSRCVPAHVRRAVWQRDGAQCTFVSDTGRRCQERKGLQFDHVEEFARGGEATAANLRLRCWAHNQYAAECAFGSEFMRHKRIATAEARASAKARVG